MTAGQRVLIIVGSAFWLAVSLKVKNVSLDLSEARMLFQGQLD